jgi:apolipoprotein N-acyltransferase
MHHKRASGGWGFRYWRPGGNFGQKKPVSLLSRWSAQPYYLASLAVLSGLLLGLGWYAPTAWLVFVGFAPILAIEKHIFTHAYRRPKLVLWGYVYLAFLVWNLTATWWLWNASAGAAVFAFMANSLLMSIPLLLFHLTKKASNDKFGYLSFFMFWLTWEYLHLQDWGFSWPWLTLGNAFGFYPAWVQWYEYSGVLGGSLWALMVNFLVFEAIWENPRIRKLNWALAGLVMAGPLAASWVVYADYQDRGTPVEVAVVQPNLDCYAQKFEYNAHTGQSNVGGTYVPYNEQVDRFLSLSKQVVGPNTAFLAFPETSLHRAFEEQQIDADSALVRVRAFRDQHPRLSLLSGADTYVIHADNANNSPTIRRSGQTFYEVFNTAVFFGDRGQAEFYHKSRLVVGVEENPLAKLFRVIDDRYMINMGGMVGNLGKQKKRAVFFNRDSLGLAPLICYESIYGEFVTGYVREGAHLLGVISNDGWWGNTPGHVQLLAIGALRAIETRRPIARAANTGISGFINQRGEVVQASRYDEMVALKATVKANDEVTFYVRWGDYLGRLTGFLAGFMLISSLVRGKLRPKVAPRSNGQATR